MARRVCAHKRCRPVPWTSSASRSMTKCCSRPFAPLSTGDSVATGGVDERFAGLLLRHRGRTGLTQRQLASRIGVHRRSIQCWESGDNYPSAVRLQAVIGAFLQTRGFAVGEEEAEAEALWDAALWEASRMAVPFDHVWFRALSNNAETGSPPGGLPVAAVHSAPMHAAEPSMAEVNREDWADAPDIAECVGRDRELGTLRQWVLEEHC